MKKWIKFIPIFIVLIALAFFLFIDKSFSAGDTVYRDWGEISILPEEYSFSSVFRTKDTDFKIIRTDGKEMNGTTNRLRIGEIKDELVLLITNCAVNNQSELMDVLIRIDNIQPFANAEDGYVLFAVLNQYTIPKSQNDPYDIETKEIKDNTPLIFEFYATTAQADFSMTYYKSGTYNEDTNTGELGGITHLNGIYYDIDIPANDNSYKNENFGGNEGFIPTKGNFQIVYNKNKKQATYPGLLDFVLMEEHNGIAIGTAKRDQNVNSIWFGSSAFILASDLEKSTYNFTYSGKNCGIYFMFASPYPFEMSRPIKSASVNEAKPGDSFEYYISQNVPNNYYGTSFKFNEIYPSLYSNTRFTQFEIKDELDENLIIDKDNIKIKSDSIDDASRYFNIFVDGNTVTAAATHAALNTADFYAHTYTITIPVTLKESTKKVEKVSNVAKTTSKMGSEDPEEEPSDEADVKVKYKLTVNYYEYGTNKPIPDVDSIEEYHYYGDRYNTGWNNVNDKEWTLVNITGNREGYIEEDTEVNYYFKKREYELTINYYDEDGNPIVDSTKKKYEYNSDYSTNHNNDAINDQEWEYVKKDGDPENGKMTKNIVVNYYFKKKEYKLTVNYYDEEGNPIAYSIEENYKYGSEYTTSHNHEKIKSEEWEYVKTDGDKTEGTITKDTVVNYYFRKVKYKLIVNYYDESGNPIDKPSESMHDYGINYNTSYEHIINQGWEYVKTDGDPVSGIITKDTVVNYYFKRLKYKLTVYYYDIKTNEIIDESNETREYGEEYTTDYSKIDSKKWKYVKTDGDKTEGTITKDTVVNYYFDSVGYRLIVNYYEDGTDKKIIDSKIFSYSYEDSYQTDYEDVDNKEWELVKVPDNYKGIVTEDIEVNYYFKKKKYKLTVNYYEEGTNKKIVDSYEKIFYYEDEYITDYNKINDKEWKIVKVPDNYQGVITEDTVVNYYFKKVKYKLTVNYYDENGNKIVESDEFVYGYNDEYVTDYEKVDSNKWELVEVPDNYKGIITGDTVINYYFKGNLIQNPQTGMSLKLIIPFTLLLTGIFFAIKFIINKRYKNKIYKI